MSWIVPDWKAPANVVAVSTTREGEHDERARLAAMFGSHPVQLRQVHGTHVVAIDAHNRADGLAQPPQADADPVPGRAQDDVQACAQHKGHQGHKEERSLAPYSAYPAHSA